MLLKWSAWRKIWNQSVREQKHTVMKAWTEGLFTASLPNRFSPRQARINVSFCFKHTLEYVKAFLFCFRVYWGDHTRFTRAPAVVPWGFHVGPKSLMTDDKQINTDDRSHEHLYLVFIREWGWGRGEKSRQKVKRGLGGRRGEGLGEAERPPKKAGSNVGLAHLPKGDNNPRFDTEDLKIHIFQVYKMPTHCLSSTPIYPWRSPPSNAGSPNGCEVSSFDVRKMCSL